MSSFLNNIVPSIVGPMQYIPTDYCEMSTINYLTYNWYLCSKHMNAIKKIDETAQNILRDSHIWSKFYHYAMIAFLAVPIIGHITTALELLCHRIDTGYCASNCDNQTYRIDTYRESPDSETTNEIERKVKDICNGRTKIKDLKDKDLSNEYFVFDILRQDGMLLKAFPDDIKKNKAAALVAVNQNIDAFEFIADELKQNIPFLLACLESENAPQFFKKYIPEKLQNDFAFCLQTVAKNGFVYEMIPEEFKKYDQMILESFTDHYSIVEESNWFDERANIWNLLPESLQKRPALIKAILARNGNVLGKLSEEQRNNPDYILIATGTNYKAFKLASNEKRNDKQFFLKAIKINPGLFKYATQDIKKNKAIVLKVLDEYGAMLKYVDPELLLDREVNIAAVKGMGYVGYAYRYIHPNFHNDEEIALIELGRGNCSSLEYMGAELKNNKKIIRKALIGDYSRPGRELFRFASKELRKDKPFVIELLKGCRYPEDEFKYVADELKNDPEIIAASKR